MKVKINVFFDKIISVLRSLSFRVAIAMIILAMIPAALIHFFSTVNYRQAMLDEKMASLQSRTAYLAKEIGQYVDNMSESYVAINQLCYMYSEIFDARVMLVDSNFVINIDTYSYDRNKYLMSKNLMSVFSDGKVKSSYNSDSQFIEAAVPVVDADKKIVAVVIIDISVENMLSYAQESEQTNNYIIIAIAVLIIVAAVAYAVLVARPMKHFIKNMHTMNMGYYEMKLDKGSYSELKEFEEAFNQTMTKMKNLDASRQEFVSNVSHELKTPITSMKVLADSLNEQDNVPVEVYQEFMQDIVDEIDRESKIIDDLLSLVKLDRSTMNLNISSVNINELIELIMKRLRPIAQKKNVELLLESFRPVVAEVDEVKLTLAISNLIENAIKYNRNEGWVHVSLNADHQYFFVRIEDSGIGIPAESQDMIFERFYRVDKARSRQTGGTGLGLAIVKNCILLHNGDIKVHSEEDIGTTFTVRIPINYLVVK